MNLKLRELREQNGISVATMTERLGVKDSRYRKWESQAAAIPIEYAIACSRILHCTLDELAGRSPRNNTADELELLAIYRSANAQGRAAIMAVARSQQGMEGQSSSHMSATA